VKLQIELIVKVDVEAKAADVPSRWLSKDFDLEYVRPLPFWLYNAACAAVIDHQYWVVSAKLVQVGED
jgi:hypothetical protein